MASTSTLIENIQAVVARPDGERGPVVVLCHDAAGIDGFMRDTVALYAEEGYVAVLPDLTGSSDPVGDLSIIIRAVRTWPDAEAKIGLLGFGAGAETAFKAAASLDIDAAVTYGGEGFNASAKLRCPITIQLPGGDNSNAIKQAFAGASDVEVFVYDGLGKDFENPASSNYMKALALLAHDRAIGRFRRAMGPHYDLGALWEHHKNCEFIYCDTPATMASMVASPYVNHIPTMTGGVGFEQLARFYKYHFIPKNSAERNGVLISRTIGATQVVEEILSRFRHDTELDWMLPGVKPTGKWIEIPMIVVIKFRGPKLYHEHIYWDQASVLAQVGLIDPTGLPVAGAAQAHKLIDESLPSNTLLPNWSESEGKPIP